MTYNARGEQVYAEAVLDREELASYYDRHGIAWRRDDETDHTDDEEPR